mgnify:CR=1 FL=1
MDSYNKLFMIIRKTDLLNYDEKNELQLYLMNLQEQVKKPKEVIDKITNAIQGDIDGFITINEHGECNDILELLEIYLDILKEVSE